MQNLPRRSIVAIKDYDHMKAMDENATWLKLTHLLSLLL